MTNALLGYMIGKYYCDTGCFADINELFVKGLSFNDFRTKEVERFLAIQQLVDRQDVSRNKPFVALHIHLSGLLEHLPEEDLPFYFLPLAYLRGATFEEVLKLAAEVVTSLITDEHLIEQVMSLVAAVKWSMTTRCSYVPYLQRCFPNVDDYCALNIAHPSFLLERSGIENVSERQLKNACLDRAHAAVRCAVVYALSELPSSRDYQPSMARGAERTDQKGRTHNPIINEDFAVPFPLKPRLTSHVDTHIIDGHYRLDGYVGWQMKSKKEPLLEISILGDALGPDRDVLRFWNFCDKLLDWNALASELDHFFNSWLHKRVDWRSMLKGHEVQWQRKRVAFLLNNERCLSFVPDYKQKLFVLDKEEANQIGIPRFHFAPKPAVKVLEELSERLMGGD